jgi:hypothetical protein
MTRGVSTGGGRIVDGLERNKSRRPSQTLITSNFSLSRMDESVESNWRGLGDEERGGGKLTQSQWQSQPACGSRRQEGRPNRARESKKWSLEVGSHNKSGTWQSLSESRETSRSACKACVHVLQSRSRTERKKSVWCEGMQWMGEPTGDDPDQESNQAGEPRLSVKAIPLLIPAQARRRENTSDAY